jgi:hypothetical protein
MTSAKFGTYFPTYAPNTPVGCTSSLRRKEIMGGWLMSCFLTTILVLTMLGTWIIPPILSCPSLCIMDIRKGARGKPTCAFTPEHHSVLTGLKEYGYSGIDDSSKVRHLLKGIKTTELDVLKSQVMASTTMRDDFPGTVELYSTFIKQMKA